MGLDLHDIRILIESAYTQLHKENEELKLLLTEVKELLNQPMGTIDRARSQVVMDRMTAKHPQPVQQVKRPIPAQFVKRQSPKFVQESSDDYSDDSNEEDSNNEEEVDEVPI